MESTPTRRGSIVYASPSSELQVSSKNTSPGGVSETVCPSNGIHSRRASQQDPFALDHTQTAAFPNALDPEEHGPCIRMLQDAQVASEDLVMRVEVAEQDKETLIRKIKSLVDDVSRLRLQAAVSDKQALQDRIEGLMRQIGYLMSIPKNEEYLSQIKFLEAEARGFRQAKFDTEQLHAQTVSHLQTDKEVLTRKIEVTKHCYSTELTRVSELLECEREMTKRAVQDYELVKAKNSKLETELDEERSKVSELHMYFNQQQERGHAANDASSQNIRSMVKEFENLTKSARVHGQHLGIVDRALQDWLGNSVDEPPPEPRRH